MDGLLKFNQTWSFIVGKFITDGVWWFSCFVTCVFERSVRHGKTQIMLPLALLYSLTMIGSIGGGWFPNVFYQ